MQKVSDYPRLVATVFAGNRVITHGAIRPRRGLNTIRLANYVKCSPKGTRLTVVFGNSSGSADVAYLASASRERSPSARRSYSLRRLEAGQQLTRALLALAACAVVVPVALAGGEAQPGVSCRSTITIGGTGRDHGPRGVLRRSDAARTPLKCVNAGMVA